MFSFALIHNTGQRLFKLRINHSIYFLRGGFSSGCCSRNNFLEIRVSAQEGLRLILLAFLGTLDISTHIAFSAQR